MKNLLRLAALALGVAIGGTSFAQTPVAGVGPGGGIRVADYNGVAFAPTWGTDNVGNVGTYQILAVGTFVLGSVFDVILLNGNRYLRWSYDITGARYSVANIREAVATRGVGTGDFDGDGNLEFVVQNTTTGAVFAYELDAFTGMCNERMEFGNVTAGTSFSVACGVSDTNGDNWDDIVLQDPVTRQIRFRRFAFTTKQGLSDVVNDGSQVVAPNGTVVGATNGLGGFQLHIRSASNGVYRTWEMAGTVRLTNAPTPGWNANWSMVIGQ